MQGSYTIFCDDIRMEFGNKLSYMGVYNGSLNVKAPKILAKISICAVLQNIKFNKDYIIKIAVDDNEVFSEPVTIDKETSTQNEAIIIHDLIPFKISGDGEIKVHVSDGKKEIEIGSLEIIVTPEA